MKRMLFLALALLCLPGLSTPAAADIGTVDDVPAATLLLPYFEVDLDDPEGITTLFSINNASATAVLAHVVIWSDLSVPVLDFNIYLTGYDVQTINLRDILVLGLLPQTFPGGGGEGPGPDPLGLLSDPAADINLDSCEGQLPLPDLPSTFITHLQNALTGRASTVLGNRCAGLQYDDRIARGYITVDTVNNCTLRFPGDVGYFAAGGLGDATNQNVLFGDYFYAAPGQDSAEGETLVHIEADATHPETSVPGEYTFYGRYVSWTAIDNREPLTTNFAVRFLRNGAFAGGTDLIVWRDSKVNQGAFTCPAVFGTRPPWFPLGVSSALAFDEEENLDVEETFPFSPVPPAIDVNPFAAETQRATIGGRFFYPIAFDFGWLFLDLNTFVTVAGNNPPEDPQAAQAWITVSMSADRDPNAPPDSPRARGRFATGFDAIQLDSATNANHEPLIDER